MQNEKQIVIPPYIKEATPQELISINLNKIARYERETLKLFDNYFHLSDAVAPIEFIGKMKMVYMESEEYKNNEEYYNFNAHFNIQELFLMLNKAQDLFNKKQSSEEVVEILTDKILN